MFVADYETTTDVDDCRVWAWGIINITDLTDFECGNNISSFIERVIVLCADVYFHNLAFDGRFLIDYLMKNGWVHRRKCKAYELGENEFSTLISSQGKFYQITIRSKYGVTVFKDSLKLIPMGVAKIAKAYNFPETEQKGVLDYDSFRPIGHELNQEEKSYLYNDVLIVAKALRIQFDKGLTRMTVGSNAFKEFNTFFDKNRWNDLFPVLSLEIDKELRGAYRGGYTFCKPDYKGVDVFGGISVDYNSMYPSVMLDNPYPIGVPVEFVGQYVYDKNYPLFVQNLTCLFFLKDNAIPTIQLVGSWSYTRHEYIKESLEPVSLSLSSIDLEIFLRMYDVDVISWDGGFKFRSAVGLFDSYIHKWQKEKEENDGGARVNAKLMLNSLYGKFGTNPDVTPKIPELHGDVVVYVLSDEELRDPVYLPIAIYVTAYARRVLIDAIMANYDRFIYCDTDCLHLIGNELPDLPLHDTAFSHWKIEGEFSHARHLRSKCYIWDLNNSISVVCAGMPDNVKAICNFDNFRIGFSNLDENGDVLRGRGKLIPKSVSGGVVLVPSPYQLR